MTVNTSVATRAEVVESGQGGNRQQRLAVLIPCYNEAVTIGAVVADFRRELPQATIYVYDNNSSDQTAAIARDAGAVVIREKRQGKGNVVQSMFQDIDADLYVMVDGDSTYPADRVHDLLAPVAQGTADLVVGNRLVSYESGSYRPLHVFGNRLVVGSINFIFKSSLHDVMSGYRAFNRDVVRGLPIISRGFEVETELTLQALYRGFVITEIPVHYAERPAGSFSKLSTFRDGLKVLLKIAEIFRAYRPLFFFGMFGFITGLLGLVLGAIPIHEFLTTGKIARFPTAILASALEILAFIAVVCGILLDSINLHFREVAQLVIQSGSSRSGEAGR